ncbi:MAG: hypothetical protein C0444_02485 [Microbacterium sp.]|nr:hypothetical protein [Microbacterium sp.]MBA4345395.1 hypothetical protein [Microbacterium sp.]
MSTDAGLSGDAGVCGVTGLSAETGEAGDGVAGDEVEVGDEMLSLSTRKSSSMRSSPSVTVPMPGTERPVAFSINGMAFAMLAAPPAATPSPRTDAAPIAIQFLLSMMFLLLSKPSWSASMK